MPVPRQGHSDRCGAPFIPKLEHEDGHRDTGTRDAGAVLERGFRAWVMGVCGCRKAFVWGADAGGHKEGGLVTGTQRRRE